MSCPQKFLFFAEHVGIDDFFSSRYNKADEFKPLPIPIGDLDTTFQYTKWYINTNPNKIVLFYMHLQMELHQKLIDEKLDTFHI